MEKETGRWRRLIAEVRRVYHGRLLYSANWDHYQRVEFWDALDLIGLSGYYELTRTPEPTFEQLAERWSRVRDKILGWRRERGLDRPIVFTEIGYANRDGANMAPWDYSRTGPPDPEEQALCYNAFIQAWHGVPELRGVYFYNWFGYDTIEDTGYSPRGKPAAKLIDVWYRHLSP